MIADAMSERERLITAIETLCRHVAGLQRDVVRLANRITPAEGTEEAAAKAPPWDDLAAQIGKHLRARGVALERDDRMLDTVVRQADQQLMGVERDVARIAAQIDVIANSSYLSADIKEWIDHAKRG